MVHSKFCLSPLDPQGLAGATPRRGPRSRRRAESADHVAAGALWPGAARVVAGGAVAATHTADGEERRFGDG